jgi:hypothetical protein
VSVRVPEDATGKLDLAFEEMGEQELKNIARPVRVFRVAASAPTATAEKPAALPLPDKPSVAVLPFTNISGDPEQEYFADGIAEDIVTALLRCPWLFVIARNSTFALKGRAVDVKQVGRELGVRYAIEDVVLIGEAASETGMLNPRIRPSERYGSSAKFGFERMACFAASTAALVFAREVKAQRQVVHTTHRGMGIEPTGSLEHTARPSLRSTTGVNCTYLTKLEKAGGPALSSAATHRRV